MSKVAVYCGTRNIYPVMEVAAKSLLSHTSMDHVFFVTEDNEFPSDLPDIITTVNVSDQRWFDQNGPNYKSAWTYMAYVRLAFAKLFPQYDKLLYLDTDTIVLQDISPLLDLNLTDNFFAMIREDELEIPLEICHAFSISPDGLVKFQSDNPRPEFSIRPYFNSGVMLMNLKLLRESHMDDQLIDHINSVVHAYPDQDTINLLCHDHILPVPTEYNVIPALFPDFPKDEIRIKHFASDKPLWKSSLWQHYKRLPWDDVMSRQNQLKAGETP